MMKHRGKTSKHTSSPRRKWVYEICGINITRGGKTMRCTHCKYIGEPRTRVKHFHLKG